MGEDNRIKGDDVLQSGSGKLLAVLGATGQSGRRVVEQAVARGYEVRGVARGAQNLATVDKVEQHAVDLLDADTGRLRQALAGCDAIVSAVGIGTSRAPTTLYSRGIAAVLEVAPTGPIAVVSAVPVGGSEGHALLERRIAIPLLRRVFERTYEDMRRMEEALMRSEAAWTALRPPRLRDGAATERLAVSGVPISGGRSITTGDLATALLDAVEHANGGLGVRYVATGGRSSRQG